MYLLKLFDLSIAVLLIWSAWIGSVVKGFSVDINTILQGFPYCHNHILSSNSFDFGPIRFPVALSTLEHINSIDTSSVRLASPFNKQLCLAHIVIANFPLNRKYMILDTTVNRYRIPWKMEHYWRGFKRFRYAKQMYWNNEQSNTYVNIVTDEFQSWKNWLNILHLVDQKHLVNSRLLVFHKVAFHFINNEERVISSFSSAIVCYNCNGGSSSLIPWRKDNVFAKQNIDAELKDLQIRISNGITLNMNEYVGNHATIGLSDVPEPEDIVKRSEHHEWPLFALIYKLVYKGCLNVTLSMPDVTKDPDVYTFIT
jgi:hypothetical protein